MKQDVHKTRCVLVDGPLAGQVREVRLADGQWMNFACRAPITAAQVADWGLPIHVERTPLEWLDVRYERNGREQRDSFGVIVELRLTTK